jgi:hypothetical protein
MFFVQIIPQDDRQTQKCAYRLANSSTHRAIRRQYLQKLLLLSLYVFQIPQCLQTIPRASHCIHPSPAFRVHEGAVGCAPSCICLRGWTVHLDVSGLMSMLSMAAGFLTMEIGYWNHSERESVFTSSRLRVRTGARGT